MAAQDENIELDSNFTYQQYSPPIIPQNISISGTAAGGAVTTIAGDSGGGAVGPIITQSGGVTGYGFQAVGTSVTMTVTSAATARASLGVARLVTALVAPAVTDDGAAGYPVGTQWVDTVLEDAYISVNADAGAAVWKKTTV